MDRKTDIELDELDFAILKELETDGRQSVSTLAKRLGVSRNHMAKKLQRLLENNVTNVVGFSDPEVLGFRTFAMIGINVSPKQVNSAAAKLTTFSCVHLVFTAAGRYDIVIYVLFKSSRELSRFLRTDLTKIAGIRSTETMTILEMHKMSFQYLALGNNEEVG